MNGEGKKLAFSSKFVLEPLGHMLYTCVSPISEGNPKRWHRLASTLKDKELQVQTSCAQSHTGQKHLSVRESKATELGRTGPSHCASPWLSPVVLQAAFSFWFSGTLCPTMATEYWSIPSSPRKARVISAQTVPYCIICVYITIALSLSLYVYIHFTIIYWVTATTRNAFMSEKRGNSAYI